MVRLDGDDRGIEKLAKEVLTREGLTKGVLTREIKAIRCIECSIPFRPHGDDPMALHCVRCERRRYAEVWEKTVMLTGEVVYG